MNICSQFFNSNFLVGGDLVQLRRTSSSAIQAHMLVGKSCRGISRVVYLFKIQRHYLKEITYIKINLTAKELLAIRRIFSLVDMITNTKF